MTTPHDPAKRAAALQRLRKCLRLAASATEPGEVAAALRQAQNLMRVYGLTEDDAELADIRELLTGASGGSRLAQWEVQLADCIRTTFGVQVQFRTGAPGAMHIAVPRGQRPQLRQARRRGQLRFFGPESRVTVAVYAFETLRRQLKRARREHAEDTGHSGRALDVFCLGWVIGVREQLAKLAAPFPIDAATIAYGERFEIAGNAKQRGALPHNHAELAAYHGGLAAAEDAVLNPGVNGQSAHVPLPAKPKALPDRAGWQS